MCELALTKAQSEKRKVKSESAKRKRVLTPLGHVGAAQDISDPGPKCPGSKIVRH